MWVSPGIFLRAASIGFVTARSLTAGSIWDVLALTTTTGKAMSGKSASFNDRKQNRPRSEKATQSAKVTAGESIASLDILGIDGLLNRAVTAPAIGHAHLGATEPESIAIRSADDPTRRRVADRRNDAGDDQRPHFGTRDLDGAAGLEHRRRALDFAQGGDGE